MNQRSTKLGDMAVDGLLIGLAGGVAMGLYLVIAMALGGEMPGQLLSRFSPASDAQPAVGTFSHLAVSGVYGIIFGLILRIFKVKTSYVFLIGIGYGLLLWAVAAFAILPASSSPLIGIPLVHFLISHLLFGAIIGWLAGRPKQEMHPNRI